MLFAILLGALVLVQWTTWIFGLGRFRASGAQRDRRSQLRFVLADFFVKIIVDFRNLLALLVLLIFVGALIWVLAAADGKMADIKDGLQAVVAALGGLVGSIIGYYFGESAASRVPGAAADGQPALSGQPSRQDPNAQPAAITEAPPPPTGGNG